MDMQIKPVFEKKAGEPIIIAGPCSAETESQVFQTTVISLRFVPASGNPVLVREALKV